MKIFISHASEDKEKIAKPLAEALLRQGYEVWYDEYSLRLGDSLSQEIDRGLSTCDYGIVILSKSFFGKQWPKRELAGLIAREMSGGVNKKIILPIWHQVSVNEVREFSPTLADLKAVKTSIGLDEVIAEINRVTEFINSQSISTYSELSRIPRNPRHILDRIIPAGPIQPDGGLYPASVRQIKEFVSRWEEEGKLSFMVKVEKMSDERRKVLFNEEKFVFLFPDHFMHQVRIAIIDMSYKSIGTLWTSPKISDDEYHKAVEFFLLEMGFLKGDLLKVPVFPIINSDDSFWVELS